MKDYPSVICLDTYHNLGELIQVQGRQFCQTFFCLPSEKGSTLNGKNLLAPLGSKFIPFRADLFLERTSCVGRQTGSHKSYLPYKEMAKESTGSIQSP